MRIDSHQHFWRYSAEEYPWIQAEWPIQRDFLPDDLAPELNACGLDGCIAVQARQSLEETRWLLELAEQSPIVKGVVGWVDLCHPAVGEQLARFAVHPKLVGVRHVVQDEADDRFMCRDDFQRGIGLLAHFGLTYDILIYPRQLSAAIELARAFPKQAFVLDHLAKPLICDGVLEPWSEQIHELAKSPNVMCKLSGLVTEARWQGWRREDFQPYFDVAWSAFGPDRLMFGSDWPVALLAATYQQVFELVNDFLQSSGEQAKAKLFGLNAAKFYGL